MSWPNDPINTIDKDAKIKYLEAENDRLKADFEEMNTQRAEIIVKNIDLKAELAKLQLKYALQESSVAEAMRDLKELEAELAQADAVNSAALKLAHTYQEKAEFWDTAKLCAVLDSDKEFLESVEDAVNEMAALKAAGKEKG